MKISDLKVNKQYQLDGIIYKYICQRDALNWLFIRTTDNNIKSLQIKDVLRLVKVS